MNNLIFTIKFKQNIIFVQKWVVTLNFITWIDNKHTPHGVDVYPSSAAGVPFTAAYIACKGDPIANLQEDLAADDTPLKIQHQ